MFYQKTIRKKNITLKFTKYLLLFNKILIEILISIYTKLRKDSCIDMFRYVGIPLVSWNSVYICSDMWASL